MSDAEFDKLAMEVDVSISTGNREMDTFFRQHFQPDTGMWIHKHPHKQRLRQIALQLKES